MTREEAIHFANCLKNNYTVDLNDMEAFCDMAIKALEQKPYEKFESAKDHIYKLAGDYKCWDNRLTQDEAVELCHILEQQPRWIPTSERYPRPDDEYKFFLVTDDKGKVSVQEFYISLDEEPQPYFSGMTNVVAWMPLPNAYKEVENG